MPTNVQQKKKEGCPSFELGSAIACNRIMFQLVKHHSKARSGGIS